jgi:hypothetical protein
MMAFGMWPVEAGLGAAEGALKVPVGLRHILGASADSNGLMGRAQLTRRLGDDRLAQIEELIGRPLSFRDEERRS